MKCKKWIALIVFFFLLAGITACSNETEPNPTSAPVSGSEPTFSSALVSDGEPVTSSQGTTQVTGQIYLYGEAHAVEAILEKEFELWYNYYQNEGMRHLFVELSYYTAEFLNVWMQSDNDDIFYVVYDDWEGTASYAPAVKEFYMKIKKSCPETVFHGTDVGHGSTGERYLAYLEQNNLSDSMSYSLTQEAIEQGERFYRQYPQCDDVYRENKMAENFIREFEALNGESIMGIYGAAHTSLDALDYTNSVPCMANQLKERYSDIIYTEDLREIESEQKTITINGVEYAASYYGK